MLLSTVTAIVAAFLTVPIAAMTGISGKTLVKHPECAYSPADLTTVVYMGTCHKHPKDPTLDWCEIPTKFDGGAVPLCDYQYHNDAGMTPCWLDKIRDTTGDLHGSIYGCKNEGNSCLVWRSTEIKDAYVTHCGGFAGSEKEKGNELYKVVGKKQGVF